MRRADKLELTEEYKRQVESLAGLILFDYRGLSVDDFTQLRREMRKENATVRVVRNRILAWAVKDMPFADISEHLVGPTATVMAETDPAAAAKTLMDFAKTHEQIQVKCGVVENQTIPAERVTYLAKLPSRDVLMSMVLAGMVGPMTSLAGCFQSLHQNLAGLFDAYKQKLESAA